MKTNPKKCLVSLSGGLDSSVLLAELVKDRLACVAVGFKYGSKHNSRELQAAQEIARYYGVTFVTVDLTAVTNHLKSNLFIGHGEIPEGHYEAESMRQTVVPGRNLLFLAVLAGMAESIGAGRVAIGVHQGDHYIYPDCRPGFVDSAGKTLLESSDGNVALYAPFLHMNKDEVLRNGLDLGVPLWHTRTCYKDQDVACGKCGSCQERLAAFAICETTDPLEYESREIIRKTN